MLAINRKLNWKTIFHKESDSFLISPIVLVIVLVHLENLEIAFWIFGP